MNAVGQENYSTDWWIDGSEKEIEYFVTVIFLIVIFAIFLLTLSIAILISCLKNLKQRFNCITTCCDRPRADKLNLVCCVV
uniref:Small hydrophobic protein n=1 Tax=Caenorhabditis tropicalis TaxID=1561998 RepID=A0A1I7U389_9PELO